jgi:hypothetical protein
VIAENPGDPRLFHQRGAFRRSLSGFLRVLEHERDVFIRSLPVNFQGKSGQTGAVAVVAAFMGNPRELGAMGQFYGFVYGQRVKIRPEGNAWFVRAGAVNRVKPAPFVNHFKGGVLFQKINQALFGPFFPAGQLRVPVQFVAERYGAFQIVFIHNYSSLKFSRAFLKYNKNYEEYSNPWRRFTDTKK